MKSILEKAKTYIDNSLPTGELRDDNFVTYFRQAFLFISSFLGSVLCFIVLLFQYDQGIYNTLGLVIGAIGLALCFFIFRKTSEKFGALSVYFCIMTAATVAMFDDCHFMSREFMWFLVTPLIPAIFLEVKALIVFLLAHLLWYFSLQIYLYPAQGEVLSMFSRNISSREYWLIHNQEFLIIFSVVLIIIFTYLYVVSYLSKRFLSYQLKMAQTAKLSSLGEMAGNIGHEINNPLSIIKVNAAYLRRLYEKKEFNFEKAQKNIEMIETTINRISNIIKSVQLISRQQPMPMKKILVDQAIEEILPITQNTCDYEKIKLEIDLEKNLYIDADEIHFAQIIMNLVNNAIFAAKEATNPSIKIEAKKVETNCVIKIMDNGRGVSKEILDKIFEPFFTSKPVGIGTGLGLSISLSMAKKMNADINYQRIENKTVFSVIFKIC